MEIPSLLLAAIAGLSLLAFGLALADKLQARRRGARVPERVLLAVALAGGSPGLALGMAIARHKTRKPSFLLRFGGVLAIQAAAVAAWVVRGGA